MYLDLTVSITLQQWIAPTGYIRFRNTLSQPLKTSFIFSNTISRPTLNGGTRSIRSSIVSKTLLQIASSTSYVITFYTKGG